MPGSHNAERPSHSPRRASYNGDDSGSLPYALYFESPPFNPLRPGATICMPSPERNQYSNKESAKVNAGLEFGGGAIEEGTLEGSTNILATEAPAVDMDFSQPTVRAASPSPARSAGELIQRLLHPPPHAFVHGVLSIQWVRGAIGEDSFDFSEKDERYVLSHDSELRTWGGRLRIPAVYMEWLCGDSETVGSTEQGVYLTPEFFEEIQQEELGVQDCPE